MGPAGEQILNVADVQRRLREFAAARDWDQFHSHKCLRPLMDPREFGHRGPQALATLFETAMTGRSPSGRCW